MGALPGPEHASRMTSSTPPPIPPAVASPSSEQPPPGVAPGLRPALRRSGTDRLAGGVCGGLADYSGIDALLWRVGFVGLTVAGGSGVLLYLLLWVLMPAGPLPRDTEPGPAERLAQRCHTAVSDALARSRRA